MNTNTMELNMNEMEQVNGGNFLPNDYSDIEYGVCGITVVHHTFKFDEFWWLGTDIGSVMANKVMYFTIHIGRQPYTLQEAIDYCDQLYDTSFGK